MAGATLDLQIIPFRGEYYMIRPERRDLVRRLIYPVPDPSFRSSAFTSRVTVHGELEAGPNAVLRLRARGLHLRPREPGRAGRDARVSRLLEHGPPLLADGQLRDVPLAQQGARSCTALQRLVPDLRSEDVTRGGAGVRAQAVSPDGAMVDDFRIVAEADAVHVLNAPSPGATASIAIGRHIAGLAVNTFGLS